MDFFLYFVDLFMNTTHTHTHTTHTHTHTTHNAQHTIHILFYYDVDSLNKSEDETAKRSISKFSVIYLMPWKNPSRWTRGAAPRGGA